MPRDLANLLAPGVVREQVELAGAVGPEVDRVPDPHRVGVVGARFRLRDLFDASQSLEKEIQKLTGSLKYGR